MSAAPCNSAPTSINLISAPDQGAGREARAQAADQRAVVNDRGVSLFRHGEHARNDTDQHITSAHNLLLLGNSSCSRGKGTRTRPCLSQLLLLLCSALQCTLSPAFNALALRAAASRTHINART
eukprot:1934662-Pleurochrysis_carterae.AAC.3